MQPATSQWLVQNDVLLERRQEIRRARFTEEVVARVHGHLAASDMRVMHCWCYVPHHVNVTQ